LRERPESCGVKGREGVIENGGMKRGDGEIERGREEDGREGGDWKGRRKRGGREVEDREDGRGD
jgi:hypothetical protein